MFGSNFPSEPRYGLDNTGAAQVGYFVRAIAEVGKHLVSIFAESRWRPVITRPEIRQCEVGNWISQQVLPALKR